MARGQGHPRGRPAQKRLSLSSSSSKHSSASSTGKIGSQAAQNRSSGSKNPEPSILENALVSPKSALVESHMCLYSSWAAVVNGSGSGGKAADSTLPLVQSAKSPICTDIPRHSSPVKISNEDIENEVRYWQSSFVGFVLGANLPLHVIKGFVKRIWKDNMVEKVGMVDRGVFLVKLSAMEDVPKACASSGILFDQKPFLVKPWKQLMSYDKNDLASVLVWVRFHKLDVVYWGESRMRKIGGMLGEVPRIDNATLNFDKLMFSRLLIDMRIDGGFPEEVYFTDAMNNLIEVMVLYDWKPILCSRCQQLGHLESNCKVDLPPTTFEVPVLVVEAVLPAQKVVQEVPVTSFDDAGEGFQVVRGRSRSEGGGT